MRYSQTFIPTVKEVPAEAEIISHQLMIRAGLMRKLASGTYIYLPAGQRILLKVMNIVREEMNRAGAQECTVPVVQPMELWQKTGRDMDYGETLGKFRDRHGRMNVLSPTAEEGFTYLASQEIQSYKQLPLNLYQINTKYRDEFRPRFGVLRSREFLMKDAYSFHATEECLHKTYMDMYNAYRRVFARCGLEFVIVEAETGEMGGTGSHQFTVPCENGEDVIVYTEDGQRAWNIEKAPVDPLPKQPPVRADAPAEVYTPNVGSIEAVCAFLKARPQDLIKTLIYKTDEEVFAVLVRGDHEVNPEKVNQFFVGHHIELADEETIRKVTGAAVGFAGPVGLAERVGKILIDHAVAAMAVGITGANKTDSHLKNVVPGRDFPLEGAGIQVCDVRNAVAGDTWGGKKLLFKRGIEVGQVFKLGTKYSVKLEAFFLDEEGRRKPCLMGCYGIGINRIVASAIEQSHDEWGIIWPMTIAPWQVIVTPAAPDADVMEAAERIYRELLDKGIEVLLDDRDLRAGVKFKDADLLGIPIRIMLGKNSLAEGKAEVKLRSEKDKRMVEISRAADFAAELVQQMLNRLNAVSV
ncbi:MAG TPA: proline--tRNA ligase [Anaerohalosphaeraceae bacterium]|nr:proline--tRNA ligase [Anaerohalosphaeraceae bacterium]